MEKRFNLSELRDELSGTGKHIYFEEDVKEFIKRLKESIREGVIKNKVLPLDWCYDRIDELVGDKLIEEKNK